MHFEEFAGWNYYGRVTITFVHKSLLMHTRILKACPFLKSTALNQRPFDFFNVKFMLKINSNLWLFEVHQQQVRKKGPFPFNTSSSGQAFFSKFYGDGLTNSLFWMLKPNCVWMLLEKIRSCASRPNMRVVAHD